MPPIGCSRQLDTRKAPLYDLPIPLADSTAPRTEDPTIRTASSASSPPPPNRARARAPLERLRGAVGCVVDISLLKCRVANELPPE